MKYLLLIAFVAVIWWAWRKRSLPPGQPPAPAAREPEAMVVCAHCGVHLPKSDSVADRGLHFCSDAHRLAARAPADHD
jgi:uncharacterized protein